MKLSTRELDVLHLIAQGHSNKQISKILFLSVNTIDTYRRKLFLKFGVHNAASLISRAYETKVLPLDKSHYD